MNEAAMSQDGVRELTYGQAVKEAIAEEMRRDARVFLLGEDVDLMGSGQPPPAVPSEPRTSVPAGAPATSRDWIGRRRQPARTWT